MCDPISISIGTAVLSALGAGTSAYQGQQAMKQQKKANQQAQSNAEKLYADQQAQENKAAARQPNVEAAFEGNRAQGQSATMLTGPTGVDPNSLSLGKNTLLGGA